MKVMLRKGGHRDLLNVYPAIQTNFDEEEMITQLHLHRGMLSGAVDLWIICDEQGLAFGYAVVFNKSMYGYAFLKYFGVLPWYRGHGIGVEAMRELHKKYADRQGILTEITDFPDEDENRQKKLRKFFARFGYVDMEYDYAIRGTAAHVMIKPIRGNAELGKIAPRILNDYYSRVLDPFTMEKMITL